MKRFALVLILFVYAASEPGAWAQPTIAANGVRNSGSYAFPALPNGSIAEGSIFVVFGTDLGPAKIVQVSSFPLPTTQGLSGTSIQVTVNGTTVDAIMLYTLATQVAAVLPSDTPLGSGMLTVTYNGQTSNSVPINVVKSSFGIFAVNQSGSGQGVFQNVISQTDRPFNSSTVVAQPGQVIILWGTGLGPVSGIEQDGPLPGNIGGLDIHVYVAGVEAQIQYNGRSGCCVGDDQIVFVVPAGVQGCSLPVYVQIGAIISNFVTMAVGPDASSCPNPDALSGSLLATAQQKGGLNVGDLSVGRFITVSEKSQRNDNVFADFEFIPLVDLGAPPVQEGACSIGTFPGGGAGGGGGAPRGLEAGNVTAATPVGSYPLPEVQGQPGDYGITFFPGYPNPAPTGIINNGTVLTPGTTTFTWTGGSGVSGGSGSIDFPVSFQVTSATVTTIDRSQGLTITWTGATKGAIVSFSLQSQVSAGVGAALSCSVDAALGKFTISSALLSALPPSYSASGTATGAFSVSERFTGSFTAPGIDIGITEFTETVDFSPVVIK